MQRNHVSLFSILDNSISTIKSKIMAIGYATVISKFTEDFFDNLLKDVQESHQLFTDDGGIVVFNEEGDSLNLTKIEIENLFKTRGTVYFKFINIEGNYLGCTIRIVSYLVTEEYSMDELLNDSEYDGLFNFVESRFKFLRSCGLGIGFIFDPEGYSEDYIRIDNNVWG